MGGPVRAPRFAVIGTGRCGTAYTAAMLRACGVNCGHEQWWTPFPGRRVAGLDGDSSWLALPDIESGAWSGPVLHIIREPISFLRSFLGIRFFRHPRHSPFREYAFLHEPAMVGMDRLPAAVHWWVNWNARCAAVADMTVQIETITDRLPEIGALIGVELDPDAAADVPTDTNASNREHIDEEAAWELLGQQPARFGYYP